MFIELRKELICNHDSMAETWRKIYVPLMQILPKAETTSCFEFAEKTVSQAQILADFQLTDIDPTTELNH